MKPLDVVASVDFGYRLVWAERAYLARLALVPVVIKLLSIGFIMIMGWQQAYLRTVMVMVPSMFAYGWMLSHLVRLVFWDQRWPFRPTGNAVEDGIMLHDRARGISAGTLCFVVISYLLAGLYAVFLSSAGAKMQMAAENQPVQEPNGLATLAGLAFIGLTLWSVRFMFLYIPAAAGVSLRPVSRAPQGMLLSLQMTGVGLVCSVPLLLMTLWVQAGVLSGATSVQDVSLGEMVFLNIWTVVISMAAQMIVTAAIAHGIKLMMSEKG